MGSKNPGVYEDVRHDLEAAYNHLASAAVLLKTSKEYTDQRYTSHGMVVDLYKGIYTMCKRLETIFKAKR